MSEKKIILSSLSLDLRRSAQGYFRGSTKMADRFLDEAFERKREADLLSIKPYLKTLLGKMEGIRSEPNLEAKAEQALMLSTLFQNASLNY